MILNGNRFFFKKLQKTILIAFMVLSGVSIGYAQEINNGVLNISNSNKLNDDVIDLTGNWQFYYGKHLTAEQMNQLPEADKIFIKTPASWTDNKIKGKKIPAFGIGTYYLKIVLNKCRKNELRDYGFKISSIISAYNLYVNGQLIGSAGNATQTPKGYAPTYYPQSCYFHSHADTLNVVFHITNFTDPLYGGIWKKMYFGDEKNIETFSWRKNAVSLFILSAFVLLFFYQLSISFIQKEEESHLIISFMSLISFVKLISDGDVSIFNFFPNIDFTFYYRIWLWSFLLMPLILRLTKITFPREVNKYIERGFYLIYTVIIFGFVFLDIQFILNNLHYVVYITFACIIYLFYILIKAVIRGRKYSIISFITFSIMILGILYDLVFLSFQFTYGYNSHFGILIYITIQSITVTLKFASEHKQVLLLSNELADSNKNLEALVEGRTKQLNDANKELALINKQKDFLISTISHDLMGFFNTLINFTKTLSNDQTLSEVQHKSMSKLYQTSNKGFLLLDNILTWAKLQIGYKPEMRTINKLSILVDEIIYLYTEQLESKSLKTIVEIDNLLLFKCNIGNLNTIFRNLLSNAIKYSNVNGVIKISNTVNNEKVQLTISDKGVGISYNELITIFDPEKTKKREGTAGENGSGLGLLIVKELVESNNGHIYCNSQLNHGTSFVIEFPIEK